MSRPSRVRGMATTESDALARAIARREPLRQDPETTAYRLFNGAADGLPGVTVDRYDLALVVNLYGAADREQERRLVAALAALPDVAAIYVKRRLRSAARLSAAQTAALAPPAPTWGRPLDEAPVCENGLRFVIRPGAGMSTGLFLDMRQTRARVRALAAGRSILNLFAYTCAFGVAAAVGGAARVLNLDAARPALRWGMANYVLNTLSPDPFDFVYGDAFDWLERLARRGARFDVVIADPPSFSTVKGRRFVASRDYTDLAAACARVTAPGGRLLCCSNEEALLRYAFRAACLRGVGAAGRTARIISYDSAPALDFPTLPGEESYLKALLLEVE